MRSSSLVVLTGTVVVTVAFTFGRPGVDDRPTAPLDTAAEMEAAANGYLETLEEGQIERGTWPLDAEERFDWAFVPTDRYGVRLKDMTAPQREAAHGLLQSVLSSQGYLKTAGVMQLEGVLGIIEGRPERRDPEDYYFNIFGTPSTDAPWAWRFEGHHVSLNVTAGAGGLPSLTPRFIGSNPAVVRDGPHAGWSLLRAEETLARELMSMLVASQRTTATIRAEAPRDILSGNARRVEMDRYVGLPASEMDDRQTHALMVLIDEYLENANEDVADYEMERIHDAGLENLHFAWAGSTSVGEGHYYRIHGPTILIEYDNVQGGANHVHSVVRDPQNDFGDDLLRRHYEEAEHHQSEKSTPASAHR